MSWSINLIGKPDSIVEALNKESLRLEGKSKEEYDEVLPSMIGIVKMNHSTTYVYNLHLVANGHGYTNVSADKTDVHSQCSFELKPLPGTLV